MRLFYLILLLASTGAFAQPRLLKDVNNEAAGGSRGSLGQTIQLKQNKGKVYFAASSTSDATLTYFYATDGTANGTKMLPVPEGITFGEVGFAGGFILMSGQEIATGVIGLWSTNGVETSELIYEGASGFLDVQMNNVLYFMGVDGEHGQELWRTDGTKDGTFLVKDINEGASSSLNNFQVAKAIGSTLFFFADDGIHGLELWKSDGSQEGTELVLDINQDGDAMDYSSTTVIGDHVYFVANDGSHNTQIWKSNGTAEGTVMVTEDKEISNYGGDFVGVGNKWVTVDYSAETGGEYFVLDITTGEYSLLKDINPGEDSSIPAATNQIVVLNDIIYFNARVGNENSLWKTDGITENTVKVAAYDLPPGKFTTSMSANNGKLLVSSAISLESDSGGVLMVGDGESEFMTIRTVKYVDNIYPFQDKFFLNLHDGVHGPEPWVSDGTQSGTFMLRDINTITRTTIFGLTSLDDKIVFVSYDGVDTYKMWGSDGTNNGTQVLAESTSVSFLRISAGGNKALFSWNDGINGTEPWITDGTLAGTKMLKDIAPGPNSSVNHNGMIWLNGTAYFVLDNYELWKTDGTTNGTSMVTDKIGSSVLAGDIVVFKGAMYFLSNKNLWKSDGTDGGTVIIKQISELPAPASRQLKAGENKMFFSGNDRFNGQEIWASDGTADGTSMVSDLYNPSDSPNLVPGIVINDVAYFVPDQFFNKKLWRSDGTAEGTFQLNNVDAYNSSNNAFWSVGNQLFFPGQDESHGQELWTSDGTEEGTHMVKDISAAVKSKITSAIEFDNKLYFVVNDGVHGYELWKTDGTESGTSLAFEIAEGPTSSFDYFTDFASFNDKLFFRASEPQHDVEVWMYNPHPQDQAITFTDISDKKSTDAPFEITATASSDLPVTFEIVSGPATISSSTITLTGIGTVVVKASQEGNIDFNPASSEQSFDVELFLGLEEEANVSVWPNPATNTLILNAPQLFKTAIIKDILGRDVLSANVTGENTMIDISHLPRGMYFVKLRSENHALITRKVILK